MERVALPLPFFAFTTSVPASCTRLSSLGISSAAMVLAAPSCENSGRMVLPAWPPTTGTWAGWPVSSCTNLLARTQSSVVTPTILRGSRPFFFQSSHMAGTTEFTGLTMRATTAEGQCLAIASTEPLAMSAFVVNKSFRSWPGFLGMPAGMSTRSQPLRTVAPASMSLSWLSTIVSGVTLHLPSKCDKSAATPGAGTMAMLRSTTTSSLTRGHVAMSKHKGWPMPPAPPTTQTLKSPFGSAGLRKPKQDITPL
mmetsp:Transcript_9535/g.21696  ORF Transcript_9535/g.21696 Transcript_9535/m.21696 type:complete len:253 (+) Transcript_9535:561-1319(+)